MNKLILSLVLVLALSGCAVKGYYEACKNDPQCVESVGYVTHNTETLVSTGVAMVPHPVAPIAAKPVGKAAGYVAGLIAMVLYGRALVGNKR